MAKIRCFEPTYKELKHIFAKGNTEGGVRFEPTYKELKLLTLALQKQVKTSFEPTYKELKQSSQSSNSIEYLGF